jgi:hypothetical protein
VHGAGATPLQTESTRCVRRFPPHGRPAQRSTASPSPMWTRPDSFPARCLYTTCPPLALGSEAAPMVSTAYPVPSRVAAPAASPPRRGAGHGGPPPRLKSFPLPRAREYLRLHHPPSCGHQPEARGQHRGHGGATGWKHWGGAAGGAKRPFKFPIRRPTTFSRSPSAARPMAPCARAGVGSGRLSA